MRGSLRRILALFGSTAPDSYSAAPMQAAMQQYLTKGCGCIVTDFALQKHPDSPPMTVTTSRRLLRTRAAAEYLSLSQWKLRCLVAEGQLPVIQPDDGSPFLFDRKDLDGWAERHKRSGIT